MLEKIDLEHLKKEFELPEETKFVGYAIHLENSDEFLHNYNDSPDATLMTWSPSPVNAKKFHSLKKVTRIKNDIKPEARIVWLFDLGKHIAALTPEEVN
ncbi:hypothetical protein [Pseudoalteromonas spongiae]|uniref:hypothetical protein n=1 Tax=Pseudoalteromonas spongiae TaxID=298657 RepID=UPI00110BA124|nr:hypothetical protein [Pseudoalteromonas spongiae]TMO84592.1 hypothetical protein CWC15_09905 [Pseudoalteromonas spongiae]